MSTIVHVSRLDIEEMLLRESDEKGIPPMNFTKFMTGYRGRHYKISHYMADPRSEWGMRIPVYERVVEDDNMAVIFKLTGELEVLGE